MASIASSLPPFSRNHDYAFLIFCVAITCGTLSGSIFIFSNVPKIHRREMGAFFVVFIAVVTFYRVSYGDFKYTICSSMVKYSSSQRSNHESFPDIFKTHTLCHEISINPGSHRVTDFSSGQPRLEFVNVSD